MNTNYLYQIAIALLLTMIIQPALASDDLTRLTIGLCDFVKSNDRTSMRRKLKATGMKLRRVYPAIRCGSSGSLLRVATRHNALEAAKFIVSKVGKKNLLLKEEDGKNILQWAQELVTHGDPTKLPFVELFESKM